MGSLANIYLDQGRYTESEPLFLELLCRQIAVSGTEASHTIALSCMNNLAVIYESQGSYEMAESMYIDQISWLRKMFGDMNISTIEALTN
jgi:hypothetical protein